MKWTLLLLCLASCKSSVTFTKEYREIKAKHEYYRTLWYRSGAECFYDSSRKYGLMVHAMLGMKGDDLYIDTVPINQPTPICP